LLLPQDGIREVGRPISLRVLRFDLVMPKPKLLDERTGFTIDFALPDDLAVMVQHADSGCAWFAPFQ
jgi:hypothetical protein